MPTLGFHHTEETKKRISELKKEWWKTHPLTDELKENFRKSQLGRHHTEETKEKMRHSSNRTDLLGKRFGRLVVISMEETSVRNQTVWRCRCDCGNEKNVPMGQLIGHDTQSCGCLKVETSSLSGKNNTIGYGKAAINKLLRDYKRQAARRSLIWELSNEEFLLLISKDCHYCGSKPNMIRGHSHYNGDIVYQGIDRMNNTLGYTKENCVPCCKDCNYAKRTLSYQEFIELITKIGKNLCLW